MKKKKIVIALGHEALGTTLPEQKEATKRTAKAVADFIREDYQVVITHSNGPQIGMIHTAMNEFCKLYPEYTATPMSVCSAMSQGYIGYDLQNGIRSALLKRGIYKPVSTVLTQVVVDPYDESFYNPVKKVGRYMTREEADAEEAKGNYVTEVDGKGWQRIVSAPKPVGIVEIDTIRTLMDADQIVISCGGGGIPVLEQGSELRGSVRRYSPAVLQARTIRSGTGCMRSTGRPKPPEKPSIAKKQGPPARCRRPFSYP